MKDLILLHGALGSTHSFDPLKLKLSEHYNCYTLNFSGHGNTTFNPEGFGIECFAEELNAFIKENGLSQPNIFGYSLGGYVALYLAHREPSLMGKIITLGTKFGWSPEAADKEVSRMNPEVMEEKKYKLVSTGKLLDRHGGYTLRLDDGERLKTYDIICPNSDFLCEKINLSIDLCGEDDEYFYYHYITSLGAQ